MFERFTKDARVVVVLAQEEARDAGAERITPTHLLLGLLTRPPQYLTDLGLTADAIRRAGGGRVLTEADESALRGIGIDLNAIADGVQERFGFDIRRPIRKRFRAGNIPFAPLSKKTLELSLREAVHRGDKSIVVDHVLLGILRSDDPEVLGAVESVLPREDLREAVHRNLDQRAA